MADQDRGLAEPLGVTLVPGGVNVAVAAPGASGVEFCLFNGTEARHRLAGLSGDVFHGFVPGVGAGARYGFRAHGPWQPEAGHRFNPAKLLIDPYATALDAACTLAPALFDTGDAPDGTDSAPFVPKAIVAATLPPLAPRAVPRAPYVIYELHVRGFTRLHPAIPEALRGTFAGLAHPAAIAHLVRLGVTVVELLPIAAWIDERHLPPLGLSNYWGYNPITFLAPDPRLAPGGMAEVRHAVAALHAAGIVVILDVVFNHTGEGDRLGPTLSLRGLGNAAYYRVDPRDAGGYANDAGCGNTLALDRPWPLRLAMDAMRHWVAQAGVDGFRLDLATTLGRRDGGFDAQAPLLAAMRQDPVLREGLIIAEPWDIGRDGYQLGKFPAGWGEWNDRFRDDVRRFWRGDAGQLGRLATRLAGSTDLFGRRAASDSVNYVTAHDGFTLADLVSYSQRHNDANGEQGRDGAGENFSWNNGVEGPTEDTAILARRQADARALLATLLLARGTPMLAMGDELGRTQHGNNNAYAQDNALSWVDWGRADDALAAFTARLIAARRAHPALHDARPLSGTPNDGGEIPDVTWHRPDGAVMGHGDWAAARALMAVLHAQGDRALVAVNGAEANTVVTPPAQRWGFAWHIVADSAVPDRAGAVAGTVPIAGRAVLLLVERPAQLPRRDAADPVLLARLAHAAGISTTWHEIDGTAHAVPRATVCAVLGALDLPAETAAQARESLARIAAPSAREDAGACFLPEDLADGGQRFGIAAQTYALRHAADQGIGDFTALANLARAAMGQGAMLVGISPPHALMPIDRERASPYQPSDRRFLEPLLIDMACLPGGAAPDVAALRDAAVVDYPAVWAAKRRVLHAAWERLDEHHPAWADFMRFRTAGGEAQRRFATFTAIAEAERHTDTARWPGGLADAASADVAAFAGRHTRAVGFHEFLQFLADAQMAAAARAGAGLYRDLAVGAAPDGAEVWSQPDNFLKGFSIGAPPDPLGPLGQVWGLPPPNPHAPGLLPAFARLLDANMRHAAALRIDHVMGLRRLFVVPQGASGADGCYLDFPFEALLRETAAASHRNQCLVVGEDLGTVPEGFAARMQAARLLSYRVLWFERDGPTLRPPATWPALATACVSTHDLPTLAGWWDGADLTERAALGLLDDIGAARAARAADRGALLAALADGGRFDARDPFSDALAAAIHAHVAATPCALQLVQADDLAGETVAVNLPGTDRERPNWRRRLPMAVDALFAGARAKAILAALGGRRVP
jgi:glycogen operon protein